MFRAQALTLDVEVAYSLRMTPRFKRILEAGFWFVLGYLTHLLLHHYHNVPR
jgi:hypothetical protein